MKDIEILQTIEEAKRFSSLPGVKISERMLAAVGNPHKNLPFIHIAGTNGKGSTAAFLRSVLTEAGYKTGMFTSPHLENFTERFTVDGKEMPVEEAGWFGRCLLSYDFGVEPTMSDYCLLLAVLYFKEQDCDIGIFETGLGGRLDSTNALGVPLVGILTKIGYDHTQILGNTLRDIAGEKAGILKHGCHAVSESQDVEAEEIICRHCKEKDIPITLIDAKKIQGDRAGFSYPGAGAFGIGMLGSYQRENALAAVLAAKELVKMGYRIPEAAIAQGILDARWPGRMELLSREPFFLVDGAHNGDGAKALAESLKELYPDEKFHFIMGVLADKDYERMVNLILPLAWDVVTVTPDSSRALQGENLAAYIRSQGVRAEHCGNLRDALKDCLGKEERLRKTVAFGSLHFVGSVKKIYNIL